MTENNSGRIKVLPPQEAMRIAAGEVVDRPAALVREFLDNAIDARSLNIEVSIEEGGCKKVEVADDGDGMNREDLELCSLTHATSKIRSLDDLDFAHTLGFRGEALAAAAAVARLEIISSTDGKEAWRLDTGPGDSRPQQLEQTRRTKGVTARTLNLFESIPARKRFLKREGSEAALCRQAFIDKALAFPAINFRFIQDGKLKDFFPAVSSKKERFAASLLKPDEEKFLHEINVTGTGFNAAVVIGGPEIFRNDKRQMYVFANGRRVQDYSLVQAMEYGAQGWFPNGTHPVGAVYVEIEPALADFNIHPAKREVRFRDPGAIHHAVSGGLRNFFHGYYLKNSRGETETQREEEFKFTYNAQNRKSGQNQINRQNQTDRTDIKTTQQNLENLLRAARDKNENDNIAHNDKTSASSSPHENSYADEAVYGEAHFAARYAGRLFGLFILIELGDKLYIIDQHAAHERILYNRFLSQPVPKQELLAPIPFRTDSNDEDNFLEAKRDELKRLGIDIERDGDGWRIEALPADWRCGDAETVKEILGLRTAGENIAERWAATFCCRAAIKDGDYPDDETAFALGKEALMLPDPRCPHGRPVWTEISREALFKAVKRS
ncbi:MAG: DNA mismatch repair endonuclease MutL [Spirochaetes bacterium]|nr:DNA mismatch repair endonuclease MutL [Spirochaetota bacterium]